MVKGISLGSSKPSFLVRIQAGAPPNIRVTIMKTKTKITCDKCNYEFSAKGGNYKKHYASCDGSYRLHAKLKNCKYCDLEFGLWDTSQIANHSRWCIKNPKRSDYGNKNGSLSAVQAMNAARKRTGITNQYTKAKIEGKEIPVHPKKGMTGGKGKPHTEETKQHLREKALASTHRRLRKGTVEYNGIMLDSSWELELAKRLDELKIAWIRPDPISWVDDAGVYHNYFPDFYLTEHDLFLDPKNPQAIKVQQKKLNCLLKQYKNIVIIDTLEKCKEFRL